MSTRTRTARARDREAAPSSHVVTWTPPIGGMSSLVAALVLAAGLTHVLSLRFFYDDAFITFRYAANLAHGHGLVFNPGERVEGYSNFLWTVLLGIGCWQLRGITPGTSTGDLALPLGLVGLSTTLILVPTQTMVLEALSGEALSLKARAFPAAS